MSTTDIWQATTITDMDGEMVTVLAIDDMLLIHQRLDGEEALLILAVDQVEQIIFVLQVWLQSRLRHLRM